MQDLEARLGHGPFRMLERPDYRIDNQLMMLGRDREQGRKTMSIGSLQQLEEREACADGLEIAKETTLMEVRWKRVVSVK